MDRRGFLKAILAAQIAPYVITTSGVLMPIRQRVVTAPAVDLSEAEIERLLTELWSIPGPPLTMYGCRIARKKYG